MHRLNNHFDDKLMHIFLDNFHQGGKYIAHIASHQAELRREGKCTDQKYLSITSLQTDYLILTVVQVLVEITREQILFRQNELLVEVLTILQKKVFLKKIRKDKEKYRTAGDLDKQRT